MDSEKSLLRALLLNPKRKIKNEVLEDITASINVSETEIEETTNPSGLKGQIISFEEDTEFQVYKNERCTKEMDNAVLRKTYNCNNCGFKSKYKHNFNRHCQRKNCESKKCDQCDFNSSSKHKLSEHKELIHSKVTFDENFKGGEILKGRVITCVKAEVVDEVDKDLEGKPNDLLNLRGNVLTRIKEEYESDTCCEFHERTFKQYRSRNRLRCKTCSYGTRYRQKLFCHYRKSEHRQYKCDECSASYITSEVLKKHKETHLLNNIWYDCDQCDFKSKSQNGVTKHKDIHGPRKSLICNECGFVFKRLNNLKQHILCVHTNKDKRRFSCDICPFKAKIKKTVKRHKETVHLKIQNKKFVFCEYCFKKFLSQKILDIHLVKIHKQKIDLPTYICYTCGYQNINKHAFIAHVTRHSKHEQLFCANCDYKTYNKSNLLQHMVKHMKHVKMHKCHICSFETKRPHTLRTHIKTHSDFN